MFVDWLGGDLGPEFLPPERRHATAELAAALQAGAGSTVRAHALFDGLDDPDRAALTEGRSRVVVTGQQPGFLGGPLYTLLKIATTIALARARTAAGQATVPVFWSGDADDDLTEALAPVAWRPGGPDGGEGAARPADVPGKRQPRLGTLAGDRWTTAGATWLARVAERPGSSPLARDLAHVWHEAAREAWPWSRLIRQAVQRTFRGQGLLVISGDDPSLHAAAEPLYSELLDRQPELSRLAAQRGRQLEDGGWHAQIGPRSLAHPLFVTAGDRRQPLGSPDRRPDPATLRPGVMLRSPLQDWLLNPAGVVVGPGEIAYLRQLDPIYEALGIAIPARVPRMFGWLVPPGFATDRLRAFGAGAAADGPRLDRLAERAAAAAERVLAGILTDDLGLASDRAATLAAGRARRWRKGVTAMLKNEHSRNLASRADGGPAWVFPGGRRQERALAWAAAAALWGDELIEALVATAGNHLAAGGRGDWREYLLEVPDPTQPKDRS